MDYNLSTSGGDVFDRVAARAKQLTSIYDKVTFDFNDVTCIVSKNTDTSLLFRDYQNSWLMGWKQVGPDCAVQYDLEVQKELNERTKARDERQAKEDQEYREKEQLERDVFNQSIAGIEIELIDAESWNKGKSVNTDGYGAAIFEYAEGWAKLMQKEISQGKTLLECAGPTSFQLGFLGITGFMYGAAVSILSQSWKHGEDLKKWHNKEYGQPDAKGVINPALLTITS